MAADTNIMGWDDVIEDDGNGFILLEEGDYDFTVTGFERGRHNGSAKIPACNKAIITLSIDSPQGVAEIKENLILYKTMEWKISAFFRSLGLKKHGERLTMDWDHVLGAAGRAHIVQREYIGNDGTNKKANNVGYFIDYIAPEKRADLLDQQDDDIPF
jgi:hypothetical protein